MPNKKIEESAVTGRNGYGVDLPVYVLEDNGTTARVQIQGCGIQLRQGEIYTVASDRIQPNRNG
jgi:hypothetical protein